MNVTSEMVMMQRAWRVVVAAGMALFLAMPSLPAMASVQASSVGKGPLGLSAFRELDRLPYLASGVETRQFSSFDRAGGNNDYGRMLADGPDGTVIAEHSGAGQVDRIWVTQASNGNWGDVSMAGNLKVQLDGQTVVNAPLTDIVNGALGAPFVYPLVANSIQGSGAVHIAVPMPYRNSMRITTDRNATYYHVSYRAFTDAVGVSTFSPSADAGQDVLATLQQAGTRDPKPSAPGSATVRGSASLAPGETVTLADIAGPGALSELKLRLPEVSHLAASQVNDDGRAFGAWGFSQFTISLSPLNTGARLTRRFDPVIGNQIANVRVDGVFIGQWAPVPSSSAGQWGEQSIDLPASVTSGKSTVVIRNEFYSSDWDFNEFGYWADQNVGGIWTRADTVDVGPEHTAAEAAHGYQVTGGWAGRRSYKTVDRPQITDSGRAYWGSTQFDIAIDPANTGVRLTRRLDAGVGNQRADILVDGVQAGQWAPNEKAVWGGFIHDSVELPVSVTGGKSRITVRNAFSGSDFDVNEFHYWADSHVSGGLARTDVVDVGDLASEQAHSYAITHQTWAGARAYGQINTDTVLRDLRLRISFDTIQTVDVPVGEFFGAARGEFDVRALMSAVDHRADGWYSSWWPMPYRAGTTISLYNGSTSRIGSVEWAVTSAPDSKWAADLASGAAGYFRASAARGATVRGQDWTLLRASGHGKIVGVSQGGDGPTASFLEGDERIFIDGSKTPQVHGTGTEDFYNGGWYFLHGPVTNPLSGQSSAESNTTGTCPAARACHGLYRQLITDSVHFGVSIEFRMEHGPANDTDSHYSTTVFWYGSSTPARTMTDTLTIGNPASEQSHQYSSASPGPVLSLTSGYEGTPGTLARNTRASTAAVTFQITIDPSNRGVALVRASDQYAAYQRAAVTVDGVPVGEWLQPLSNSGCRWLDDSFPLPAAVTSGKSIISVRIAPVAGAPAWSAARYQAWSIPAS